jgi:hypothetical protein
MVEKGHRMYNERQGSGIWTYLEQVAAENK